MKLKIFTLTIIYCFIFLPNLFSKNYNAYKKIGTLKNVYYIFLKKDIEGKGNIDIKIDPNGNVYFVPESSSISILNSITWGEVDTYINLLKKGIKWSKIAEKKGIEISKKEDPLLFISKKNNNKIKSTIFIEFCRNLAIGLSPKQAKYLITILKKSPKEAEKFLKEIKLFEDN